VPRPAELPSAAPHYQSEGRAHRPTPDRRPDCRTETAFVRIRVPRTSGSSTSGVVPSIDGGANTAGQSRRLRPFHDQRQNVAVLPGCAQVLEKITGSRCTHSCNFYNDPADLIRGGDAATRSHSASSPVATGTAARHIQQTGGSIMKACRSAPVDRSRTNSCSSDRPYGASVECTVQYPYLKLRICPPSAANNGSLWVSKRSAYPHHPLVETGRSRIAHGASSSPEARLIAMSARCVVAVARSGPPCADAAAYRQSAVRSHAHRESVEHGRFTPETGNGRRSWRYSVPPASRRDSPGNQNARVCKPSLRGRVEPLPSFSLSNV
jgi:hypothetical protein